MMQLNYDAESKDDFEKLSALPDTSTKGIFKAAARRFWLILPLFLSVPVAIATSRLK